MGEPTKNETFFYFLYIFINQSLRISSTKSAAPSVFFFFYKSLDPKSPAEKKGGPRAFYIFFPTSSENSQSQRPFFHNHSQSSCSSVFFFLITFVADLSHVKKKRLTNNQHTYLSTGTRTKSTRVCIFIPSYCISSNRLIDGIDTIRVSFSLSTHPPDGRRTTDCFI